MESSESPCYLFTSFRGNGEDGLHLAVSTDGYEWTPLQEDRSFLTPRIGKDKLMRDPCLAQGPDGVFHMVWTTGWWDRSIGYASSRDLMTWSKQKEIPVMAHEPTAKNAWAPELFYDTEKGQWIIFWATTIPGHFPETEGSGDNDLNHRMYYVTTKDFKMFSPTKLLLDPGFNVIDTTMLPYEDSFLLVVKDETKKPVAKNLRIVRGKRPEGPFEAAGPPFTPSWVEGPTVLKIGDEYFIYYDCYILHKYGAMKTRDFKVFEDITERLRFPKDHRHGAVLTVTRDIIQGLQKSGVA
jgi:hypothetical protein